MLGMWCGIRCCQHSLQPGIRRRIPTPRTSYGFLRMYTQRSIPQPMFVRGPKPAALPARNDSQPPPLHRSHFTFMATRVEKVVLPLALGQLARFTPLRKLHERKPKAISRFSECVLLSIIYTTFCDTFTNSAGE